MTDFAINVKANVIQIQCQTKGMIGPDGKLLSLELVSSGGIKLQLPPTPFQFLNPEDICYVTLSVFIAKPDIPPPADPTSSLILPKGLH